MDPFSLLGWGAAVVSVLMLLLWVLHFPLRNAAIVDVGWTGSLAALALLYAALGPGWPPRAWFLAFMVCVWALRLGGYLFLTRVFRAEEEGRYQELRRQWRTHVALKFLLFFLAQGALNMVLSLPFLLVALDPRPGLGWHELAGCLLWCCGVVGEAAADAQLAAYKRSGRRGVCRDGLWHVSRHPNYFFEIVTWVGWAVFALGSPGGWLGLLSPALIALSILRVTGIPPTEQQLLRSKGEEYRRYQATTSALIPWFTRE